MQPLAYWSFEDCFKFAEKEGFSLHPLHEKGYPSVGDVHSTLPVDRSKWCAYAAVHSSHAAAL
jgi:phosphoadenosine phosphosulfate reductase